MRARHNRRGEIARWSLLRCDDRCPTLELRRANHDERLPSIDDRHARRGDRRSGPVDRRVLRRERRPKCPFTPPARRRATPSVRRSTLSMRRSMLSAKGATPDAPFRPPRDVPSDALGGAIDALAVACVAHSSEADSRTSRVAAGGTAWHRSITSREAPLARCASPVAPCASVVAPRASIVETRDPQCSTCPVVFVVCASKAERRASIGPPGGARTEACASPARGSGSRVASREAKLGARASIAVLCAPRAGGRATIVVRSSAIVLGRASIVEGCASIVLGRVSIVTSCESHPTPRASRPKPRLLETRTTHFNRR
jgi:hypothetical protein